MLMEVSGKLFMVVLVQILPFPKSVKDLIIILNILIISSTVSHSDLISQSDLVSLSDIIHQSNGVSQSNLISHSVKLSALTSDCIELDFKEISYLVILLTYILLCNYHCYTPLIIKFKIVGFREYSN